MRVRNKLVCAAVAIACFSWGASAELSPNAIGLRLGGGSLMGGEINYQKAMGAANRLELGASYSSKSENFAQTPFTASYSYSTHYFGAFGAYHWHFNITDGLNWYVGPGAGFGMWSWSHNALGYKVSDSGFFLNIGGQVGIEYNFNVSNVPLVLSLDTRPMFGLLNSSGFGWDFGLGIRYTF